MSQVMAPDLTNAALDAKNAEITRLRAALAEAERERKSIRDTCVALNEYNDELDARLNEALARAERADWQSIETAPKGRIVIVGSFSGWMEFCYQTDNGEGFLDTWRFAFTNRGEQAPWPTHWMEPPATPSPLPQEAQQ